MSENDFDLINSDNSEFRISLIEVYGFNFLTYDSERVCSIFSGAGKFCLANGLRQLTRDVRSSEINRILEVTSLMLHHEKRRMPFGEGRFVT